MSYSATDLKSVCAIVVDAYPAWGGAAAWLEAHPVPAKYAGGPAQFVAPYFDVATGFQDNSSPVYKPFGGIVRPEPFLKFMGVANRRVEVGFMLRADAPTAPGEDVRAAVAWLSALNETTPYDKGLRRYAPPRVTLFLGEALVMPAVVEQVSVHWVGPWSDAGDPIALGADVVVGFVAAPSQFDNYGGRDGVNIAWRTGA